MPHSGKNLVNIALLLISRGLSLGLQLVLQIVIARFLGPSATGAVQLFITTTSTAGEVAVLGVPANNMRHCSHARAEHAVSSVNRYLINSLKRPILVSIALALGVYVIDLAALIALPFPSWILCISIAGYSVMRCLSEALKALDQAKYAVFVEAATIPLILLPIILASVFQSNALGSDLLVSFYGCGYIAVVAFIAFKLWHTLRNRCNHGTEQFRFNAYEQWRPLWISGLLGLFYGQFALLILPFYASITELGLHSAAIRYIGLSTTLLMILASWFAPRFARAKESPAELKTLLRQTQIYSLLLFSPFAIAFLLLPETLLSVFGEAFISAKSTLQILCIAQLVNAATGIPGVLLKMAGKAHIEQNILLLCLAAALVAVFVLGDTFGSLGIISIFAILIAVKNCLSYLFAVLVTLQSPIEATP